MEKVLDNPIKQLPKSLEKVSVLLIVINCVLLTIETLPTYKGHPFFSKLEIVFVLIFAVEYSYRVFINGLSLKYLFSFYGLIDLVSILPSLLSFGSLDFSALRALRLLRSLRVFKLLRYSKAMDRLKTAFVSIKDELIIFMFIASLIVYLASVGIYHFENEVQPEAFSSIPHSIWWAVVTLTTVGYGDTYPITVEGRIFTTLILIVGLGIVAVPTGLIASALQKTE
ncbi:MAG: ion transporter [Bdellovibrionota bacterium]